MNWPVAALRDIAQIERRSIAPSDILSGSRYVGLEHIEVGGASVSYGQVTNGELASNKFRFGPNHILFGKLRPYLAKIVCPEFEGICSTDILPIAPGKRVDRRYLLHFLRRPRTVEWASGRATGVNLPRLSPTELENLEVPLPPLHEQQRIAAILDKADALRCKRKRAIDLSQTLAESCFSKKFGDESSSDFQLKRLDEVTDQITDGAHFTPTYADKGVPFLRVTDLQNRTIDWTRVKYIPQDEHNELVRRCRPEPGDVLLSKNGTIGIPRYVDWEEEFSIFVSLCLIKPTKGALSGRFLASFLKTSAAQRQLRRHSKTGTVTNLHLIEIRKLLIPIPPFEIQRKWEALEECLRQRENEQVKAELATEHLFSSLQHRAFAGQL